MKRGNPHEREERRARRLALVAKGRARLGTPFVRMLSAIEVGLCCSAINRMSDVGPAATTRQLPFFTVSFTLRALRAQRENLTGEGQRIVDSLIDKITNRPEVYDREDPR